jgi:hypothetical protein
VNRADVDASAVSARKSLDALPDNQIPALSPEAGLRQALRRQIGASRNAVLTFGDRTNSRSVIPSESRPISAQLGGDAILQDR